MTRYRRAFVPGATYFFTVNLANRRATLLVDHIDLLRDAIRYTRKRHPFDIDAMVVLPDHLHAVWTLPPGDADFSLRWRLIKTWFSRKLPHGEHRRASQVRKGERRIWRRRYWANLIRNEADFTPHVDYITTAALWLSHRYFEAKPLHFLSLAQWAASASQCEISQRPQSSGDGICMYSRPLILL